MKKRVLVWFNKDLRIKDNLIFAKLSQEESESVGLVFIPKAASKFQLVFFRQSFLDLQKQLEKFGVKLFAVADSPEVELVRWINANNISEVITSKSYNSDDLEIVETVTQSLKKNTSAVLMSVDQRTLLHQDDLPFDLNDLSLIFTDFRRQVECSWKVRNPINSSAPSLQGFAPKIPDSATIVNMDHLPDDLALPFDFVGGETAAWSRLNEYLWETQSLSTYKETRNGMLEKNDSSKFSPWLAMGCISARSIYSEIKHYESRLGANESTYWLVFELLWRDYFKFLSLKLRSKLFSPQGLLASNRAWVEDSEMFQRWCQGLTGIDFVDANMRELNQTGWMSNRGRQNVANFLAKNLQIDWTWGARFFEQHLLDYDTESNWGNWQYAAGVGTDPRNRVFNIARQAQMYDPDFLYRKKWLTD